MQSVRDQLFFSGFSSEVKPLSSERTGSELQLQPAGLRSEGAVWFSTESNLSPGDSEVSSLTDFCRSHIYIHMIFMFVSVIIIKMLPRLFLSVDILMKHCLHISAEK